MQDITNLPIAKKIISSWKQFNLNPKQIKFLSEYVSNNFNASQAYKKAGYKGKDPDVIKVSACNILTNVNVKAAFRKWKDIWLDTLKEKLEPEIANSYWRRANYKIETFQDEKGKWLPMNDIPEEWKCCIDGYEEKWYGKDADRRTITIKLPDRHKSLEKLEKYIEMIKEKREVDVNFIPKEAKDKLDAIMDMEE